MMTLLDELLANIHTKRVACAGFGPWTVIRENDEVVAYNVSLHQSSNQVQATLVAESSIEEIECPTSPGTDLPSSE